MIPRIIVTIDTECDKSSNWHVRQPLSFMGVEDGIGRRLQPLFESFGIRPTYFLSPEVICHRQSAALLKSLRNVELATHMHGDFIVPEIEGWNFAGSITDDMQFEYGLDLERRKMSVLTEMFAQQFGRKPASFRAGRFGVGIHSGRILQELGYLVDSSVTPHIAWTDKQGRLQPDFRGVPEFPYFVGPEGNLWRSGSSPLLEVPVTVLPARAVPANNPAEAIWFRPWYSDAETLRRVMEHALAQPPQHGITRPLVMMFHNVEVIAGASPYPQSEAEVARFLDQLQRTFEYALRHGVQPATLSEYYQDFPRSAAGAAGESPFQSMPSLSGCSPVRAGGATAPLNPSLDLAPSLVEPILDRHQVQSWFKYVYRERASRWDVWQPCFWLARHASPKAKVLSVGTGVGFNLLWLARHGFEQLDGFDIDAKSIAAAADLAQSAGLNARYWVDDGLAPRNLTGRKYDVIECLNWTHLLPNFSLTSLLDTYLPHLGEGGVFIIDVIDRAYDRVPGNQWHTADLNKPESERRPTEYLTRLDEAEARSAFHSRGFEIVARYAEPQKIAKAVYVARRVAVPSESASSGSATPFAGPEAVARQALAENPDSLAALKLLISNCLDSARWDEGAQACGRILQQTPGDPEVLLALAHCLAQSGNSKTPMIMRTSIQASPASPQSRVEASIATTTQRPSGTSFLSARDTAVDSGKNETPNLAAKAHILLIADVPNWIFERHCKMLSGLLSQEFQFMIKMQGQPYREEEFDLIYPLEWNLVPKDWIKTPSKYVTGIRSHTSWKDQDFIPFTEFLSTHFRRVHVVSKRLEKLFKPFLRSVSVLSHGVDTRVFQPATSADRSGRGSLRLGWAGNRINPTKGFDQFVAPLAKVPGVQLCFCGYLDQNLNLEQMRAFYDSIDAYICTSHQEGNNNSLLEAAAMERAIITSDNGTVPEYLIDGQSAFIVERDLPGFLGAVIELRDNPEKRVKLGKAARLAVQSTFEWQAMAQHYSTFFREALAQREASRTPDSVSNRITSGTAAAASAHKRSESLEKILSQAGARMANGDLAGTRSSLEEAIVLFPCDATVLESLGNTCFQMQDFAAAFEHYSRLTKLQDNSAGAWLKLSHTALRLNQVESFEQALGRALALEPENRDALKFLGDLNLQNGAFADALAVYHRILRQSPKDVDVLLLLGNCYYKLGKHDSAKATYQLILGIDPNHSLASENLSFLQPTVSKSAPPADEKKFDHICCPFCGSEKADVFRRSADIVRCGQCSTVYLRTRYKTEILEAIYQTYADDGSHMRLPKNLDEAAQSCLKRDYFLKEILQFTKPGGRFLDVGCGWGAFLLNARDHGFEPIGMELTRKAVRYANEELHLPVVNTQFLDTPYGADSLQVVTMNHVLEHLPFPKQALEKVFRVLKPGGVFCGIVPNIDSFCAEALGEQWFWLDPNYHYVHYTPATLRKHLEAAGFQIERVYTATGDYGSRAVRDAALKGHPELKDEAAFNAWREKVNAEHHGEELRFFARKPICATVSSAPLLPPVAAPTSGGECAVSSHDREIKARLQEASQAIEVLDWSKARECFLKAVTCAKSDQVLTRVLRGAIQQLDHLVQCCAARPGAARPVSAPDGFSFCIITNGKRPEKLRREIESIRALGIPNFEILVGGEVPAGLDDVTIVQVPDAARCGRLGEMRNRLVERARFEHLVVADDDLVFLPDFYQGLAQFGDDYQVQCVRFLNPDGTRYWDWATNGGPRGHGLLPYEENDPHVYVTGGLCIMKAEVARRVKWDEGRGFYQGEDADFSARLHAAGIHIKSNARCTVIHNDTRYTQFGKIILTAQSLRQTARDALKESRFDEAEEAFQTLRMRAPETVTNFNQFWLDSFIAKRDGRFYYFTDDLLPGGVAGQTGLTNLARLLSIVFAQTGPFYLHFGGAGDALLLLATFLDKNPDAQVVSFPNSIPASRSFFEAFPSLKRIWFLPRNSDWRIHLLLRMMMKQVPNCKGMGVTPEQDYWKEWHAKLNVFKEFGVSPKPRWAQAFRNHPEPKRVVLAPKGSLLGMVGSKRNIIDPAVWPRLISFLQDRGFQPAIIGTPDEARDYPCPEGCSDHRSYSFHQQIECIANSTALIGADSWAKTYSALAGIPTLVFESLKGTDWDGKKDASDFVFLDPWPAITVVKDLETCQEMFLRKVGINGRTPKLTPKAPTVAPTVGEQLRVAWEGSYLDFGSLSYVNRELTRCLSDSPLVKLTRVGEPALPNGAATCKELQELAPLLSRTGPADCQVTVRHSWPPNWTAKHRGPLAVIQPWEFGALPQEWVRQAEQVQQFWVPSNYVRNVYISSGVPAEKVKVVPNGIDPSKFTPQATPMRLETKKSFKFLFVGGTIHRKGADVLLETYLKSFTAAEDVCLVIKDFGGKTFYAGQTLEQRIEAARAKPGTAEILYLTQELAPEALPSLYTACDCLVHPYRGEGFGLPVLEAMACGLPVIVTAGGAADDFATEEFAYHIPATRRTIGDTVSGMKLTSPGWLLEPDAKELTLRMKWVFAHREEARKLGRRASDYARREWTWENAAHIAGERLQELAKSTSAKNQAVSLPTMAAHPAKSAILPRCGLLGNPDKAREALTGNKPKEAWELVTAAIQARPYHPEGFLILAEIAASIGDGQSARNCGDFARALAPNWKPARQFLNRRLKGGSRPSWFVLEELPKKPAARLTVCVIAKNEERFIGQCLASVKPVADQLVVVDTGSTDRTLEIAKSFGAEVHPFDWCDDFGAARNAALEHARGDWVLILDADEELLPDQHARLLADLNNPKAIALRLPLLNKGQEAEGRSFVPRLFRNAPGVYFTGRIHEQVFPSLVALGKTWGLGTALGTAQILHHGYSKENVKDRNKIERNLNLLQKAVGENPEDPNLAMNLGLELVRSENLEEGLQQYRRAFELMAAKPPGETAPELREALLTQFTCHLYKVRAYEEVVEVLTSTMARQGGLTASLRFALGLACFELGRYSEAAAQMRQCLAQRQQTALSPINTDILTAAPYHCLALSLIKTGDLAAAEKAFQTGLNQKGRGDELRLAYAKFLMDQGRPVDALQRLHEAVTENAQCSAAWRLGAEIALSRPEFLEVARDWTSEAIKQFPEDAELLGHRAESLLFDKKTTEARELWQALWDGHHQPRALAALLFCEIVEGRPLTHSDACEEELGPNSRAFIDWYQRCLAMRAQPLISRVNERLDSLRPVLPAAAAMIESALTEAGQETAAPEPCLA